MGSLGGAANLGKILRMLDDEVINAPHGPDTGIVKGTPQTAKRAMERSQDEEMTPAVPPETDAGDAAHKPRT